LKAKDDLKNYLVSKIKDYIWVLQKHLQKINIFITSIT